MINSILKKGSKEPATSKQEMRGHAPRFIFKKKRNSELLVKEKPNIENQDLNSDYGLLVHRAMLGVPRQNPSGRQTITNAQKAVKLQSRSKKKL